MTLRSWLRTLFGPSSRPARPQSRRFRPGLEMLESREVPAVLTVNSPLDRPVDLSDDIVTLRDAVHAAELDLEVSPGGPVGAGADTITFALAADSVLNLNTVGDSSQGTSAFRVTTDITIQGNGQTLAAPGDGTNAMRHFLLDGGALTLNNLHLTGGQSDSLGGAVYNKRGDLFINGCTLENNHTTGRGGAIATLDGSASRTTVTGSTIRNNSARQGGGIVGKVRLIDSTVSDNTVTGGFGGGLSSLFSTDDIEIVRSTISRNRTINLIPDDERSPSTDGGGIYSRGDLTIVNSTVSGNEADGDGGGIYQNAGGTLLVVNSTVTGNRSDADGDGKNGGNRLDGGGGVFVSGNQHNFHNTIVAGNFQGKVGAANPEHADDVSGDFLNAASSHNLFGTGGSGGLGATNGNQINVDVATVLDPVLRPNGGPTPTHALLGGSPAINAGTATDAPTTDQRGFGRVGAVDVGAFEVQNQAPTDIQLDNVRVRERLPSGSVVGTLRTVDADAGDTFTYALLDGGAAFRIDGNLLKTSSADLAPGTYSIRVRSTDASGAFTDKGFTITVVNVNDAPTIIVPAGFTVTHGAGQILSGLSVSDRDGDRLRVTLKVKHGELKVLATSGVTVTRHHKGKLTLSGDAASINAALAGLQYRSQGNFRSADGLSIVVGDGQVRSQAATAIQLSSSPTRPD